jgi:solute carrier family 25 protein 33/36
VFNDGQQNSLVHLTAAALAGIVTSTVTNPIWVVRTRMQLSAADRGQAGTKEVVKNSWGTIKDIMKSEGVRGFYKGLSASYLGVTEGTIQWVLYERLKKWTKSFERRGALGEWLGLLGSAGAAKFVAALISYPHEVPFFARLTLFRLFVDIHAFKVIRTRLRQPLTNGKLKYTGLWQTLRLVIAEEGVMSLYGGLSAHLMRVVPNAAVMFFIYEGILRWT